MLIVLALFCSLLGKSYTQINNGLLLMISFKYSLDAGLSRCQLDTRMAAYWPDGVVPYEVDPDDYYAPWQKFMIEAGLTNVERGSCAKFVPWSGEENYITFQ